MPDLHDPSIPNQPARPELDVVQRWFWAVMTDPAGVDEGAQSSAAQELVHLRRDELEQVIRRSKNLTSAERMGIYANAYYARLLDCLRESFPVLARAAGNDAFDGLAFDYLKAHPSRSYTLNRLGAAFPAFLEETRPDRPPDGAQPAVNWPDFLIDLARLEWEIEQVFDGPGVEGKALLSADGVRAIEPAEWPSARLVVVPCLRLLSFRFPVNEYYTQARRAPESEVLPIPAPQPQFLALNRREFIVKRHPLSRPQFELLATLISGRTLMEGVEAAAACSEASDDELAAMLRNWFLEWAETGFFAAIQR